MALYLLINTLVGELKRIKWLIASISVALNIVACRSGSSNQLYISSINISEVTGEWKTSCVTDPRSSIDSVVSLKFSGVTRTKTTTNYAPPLNGGPCSGAPASVQVEVQNLIISHNSDGTVNSEVSYNSVKTTVYDSQLLNSYNSAKICGTDQWASGVEKDITSAPCGNVTGKPFKEQKYYDLEKLEGDKYYLGKIKNISTGTAPEQRPVEIDITRPFIRN